MKTAAVVSVICVVGFAFSRFRIASAIKCWECRSDGEPKCADPFDNRSLPIVDCSVKPNKPHLPGVPAQMCRKIRQKVHGEWRYIRSCAWLGEPGIAGDERYCIRKTSYDVHIEYCTCQGKDGCNGATSHLPTKPFFSILLVPVWGNVVEFLGTLVRSALRTMK